MKKILGLFLLCVLLAGCTHSERTTYSENETIYQTFSTMLTVSDNGSIYYDERILHYVDHETEEDVILCTKENCLHKNENCEASLLEGMMGCFLYEDKIYGFVTDFSNTYSTLYERELLDTEWSKVMEVPSMGLITVGYGYGEYYYFVVSRMTIEDEEMQERELEGNVSVPIKDVILAVNLHTSEYFFITPDFEEYDSCWINSCTNSNFTYTLYEQDTAEIYQYDFENHESTLIFDIGNISETVFISGDSDQYFYNEKGVLKGYWKREIHEISENGNYEVFYYGNNYYVEVGDSEGVIWYCLNTRDDSFEKITTKKKEYLLCIVGQYAVRTSDFSAVLFEDYMK